MSNVIQWELDLFIPKKKDYIKLVTYLSKGVYTFECEPHYMLRSTTVHRVIVSCSWTNNLKALTKWIDKNISDEIL